MTKRRSPGDGALYFLKERNLWRGVVELEGRNGKRRQKMVHSRTQRACKQKLDNLKDELRGNGGEPIDKGTRLRDWAERWLLEYAQPNVDPRTYSTYRSLTIHWITPTIGHKVVSSLKPTDITDVRRAQKNAGRSTSTAKQTYIVLSRMLEQARREGICSRNVAQDVDSPGTRNKATAAKQRDAMDVESVFKLLAAARAKKNGSLWWFRLLTGQRQGEILGATLADLDLDAGFYTVNWKLEELVSDHGCGDQIDELWPCGKKRGGSCTHRKFRVPDDFEKTQIVGRLHLTRPKSKTGKRVPLIPELAELMRRDLNFMHEKPNPHGLIWRHDDGTPILPREDGDEWRKLLHEIGLIGEQQMVPGGTEMTGHVARHTVVTTLAMLGVDAQLIGEIVGHSSERVTEQYRHAKDGEKMDAMKKLGARLLSELPKIKAS